MRQRIGFYTLQKTALALCRALAKFSPYIISQYPTNTALLAALAAASAACSTLRAEVAKVNPPEV